MSRAIGPVSSILCALLAAHLMAQDQDADDNPRDAVEHVRRANAWIEAEQYDKAIGELNVALRLDPEYAYAYATRGRVWDLKENNDRAIADYSQAIRLRPDYADAYAGRGSVWNEKRDFDRAIDDLNQAIRLEPENAHAYATRGHAWIEKQEFSRAIADLNEAIRLDPENSYAYANRGHLWDVREDYAKAIDDFNQAMRLEPDDAYAFDRLAWLRATCEEAKYRNGSQAVRYATTACELTAWENAECLATLAAACAETGRFDEAVRWQTKAVELASPADKADYRQYLDRYRAKEPYRDRRGFGYDAPFGHGDNMSFEEQVLAAIVGSVFFGVYILGKVFVLFLLRNMLLVLPEHHRKMNPHLVWLAMVPLFSLYWHFIMFSSVSQSYMLYFHDRNRREFGRCGEAVGLWCAGCAVAAYGGSLVPCVGVCIGIPAWLAMLVLLIIYLATLTELKSKVVADITVGKAIQ